MALDLTDANAFRDSIRYDPLTKKGSVYDVIQMVTGQDHRHAQKTYTSVATSFPEVSKQIAHFKFPGQGQRSTPVAHLSTLLEIAWLCPGKRAKEFRRTGAVTMCRALGGDLSLVEEIRTRHANTTVEEQEMFLAGTGFSVSSFQMERTRKLENDMLEEKVKEAMLVNYERLLEHSKAQEEERDRLFFVDAARNYVRARFAPGTLLDTSGAAVEENEPVTLSEVAKGLGVRLKRGDESRIGRAVARLYRHEHDCEPPKHAQFVDGAVRKVNSYFKKDMTLIVHAIRDVLDTPV